MTNPDARSASSLAELPRRRFLAVAAAAAGGALVGRLSSENGAESSSDLLPEDATEKVPIVELSAEQAREIKEKSVAFAKKAFEQEGFSGKRQSDTLTVTQWNPTSRMTLHLQYRQGASQGIMDITQDDLESVAISYATNDSEVGAGEGHNPTGTTPPISTDGSAKNAFDVFLYEVTPKASPEAPFGGESQESAETLYKLELLTTDVFQGNSAGELPQKPPRVEDLVSSAFRQFA